MLYIVMSQNKKTKRLKTETLLLTALNWKSTRRFTDKLVELFTSNNLEKTDFTALLENRTQNPEWKS